MNWKDEIISIILFPLSVVFSALFIIASGILGGAVGLFYIALAALIIYLLGGVE